jgi:hypothetical protein
MKNHPVRPGGFERAPLKQAGFYPLQVQLLLQQPEPFAWPEAQASLQKSLPSRVTLWPSLTSHLQSVQAHLAVLVSIAQIHEHMLMYLSIEYFPFTNNTSSCLTQALKVAPVLQKKASVRSVIPLLWLP